MTIKDEIKKVYALNLLVTGIERLLASIQVIGLVQLKL